MKRRTMGCPPIEAPITDPFRKARKRAKPIKGAMAPAVDPRQLPLFGEEKRTCGKSKK